jgi:hypothetical protein
MAVLVSELGSNKQLVLWMFSPFCLIVQISLMGKE